MANRQSNFCLLQPDQQSNVPSQFKYTRCTLVCRIFTQISFQTDIRIFGLIQWLSYLKYDLLVFEISCEDSIENDLIHYNLSCPSIKYGTFNFDIVYRPPSMFEQFMIFLEDLPLSLNIQSHSNHIISTKNHNLIIKCLFSYKIC